MKNAEILSVGTELLTGSILNTNAQFLAEKLTELGYDIDCILTIGDKKPLLKQAVTDAVGTHDLIIITGGLGPTMDDLTTETVAEALNRKLVLNEEWLEHINSFFKQRGMERTDNNIKQALLPEGSHLIDNPHGTACGMLIEEGNSTIILLPGVPREMKEMFETSIESYLGKNEKNLNISYYMLTGIGESTAEDRISDIVAEGDGQRLITTYASPGEIEIRITSRENTDIKDWQEIIEKRLKKYIYSKRRERLHETVSRYLIDHHLTLASAESCTGGLIGEMLTQISGISDIYKLGIISYSNQAKIDVLNVPEKIINKFGAVSKETCQYMCENVRAILDTDIGISVTGVAGPLSSEGKPAGLVYTGIATRDKTTVVENHFRGNRETIRKYAANKVFQLLRDVYFDSY